MTLPDTAYSGHSPQRVRRRSRSVRRVEGRAVLVRPWYSRPHFQFAFLMLVALALGGGGSRQGLLNLAVQLAAFAVLGVNRERAARFFWEAPRGLLILIGLTLALPLVQLVPLPPAVWTRLPGRGVVSQSLSLIGEQGAWMPFSLDPNRTAIALAAVIACLPFAILAATMERAKARWVPGTIAAAGALSMALGAVQLAQGNRYLVVDPSGAVRSQLYATFANHNATGLFFVLCLICLPMLRFDWLAKRLKGTRQFGSSSAKAELARNMRLVRLALGTVFALCTILTQSRSSIVILALVLVWTGWRNRALLLPGRRDVVRRDAVRPARFGRHAVLAVAAVIALCAAGLVANTSTVRKSFSRFDSIQDARGAIWTDTTSVIHRFLPLGAGVGSFDEVFQLDESLENVATGRAGRAHNDYLEVLVESGGMGIALVLGWIGWVALQLRRGDGLVRGAAGVLACIALQSLVDYPLRNMAMLAIASAMIGLLARRDGKEQGSRLSADVPCEGHRP